jgi:hypothetical protein
MSDAVTPASTPSTPSDLDFDLELALKLSLTESRLDDPLGCSRHEGCDKALLPPRDALPRLLPDAEKDAKIALQLLTAARPSDLVSEMGKLKCSLVRRLARRARLKPAAAASRTMISADHVRACEDAPLPSPVTPVSPGGFGGGEALLRQRLASMNLVELPMADDGNCQFRAFSHSLFGTQEHHGVVRALCLAHMRSRSDEIAQLVGDGEELERYLASQEKYKTWGDELTLKYTADAFDVDVHVVTSTELNWYLRYYPESGTVPDARSKGGSSASRVAADLGLSGGGGRGGKRRQVFLAYVAPVHYNAIGLPPVEDGS